MAIGGRVRKAPHSSTPNWRWGNGVFAQPKQSAQDGVFSAGPMSDYFSRPKYELLPAIDIHDFEKVGLWRDGACGRAKLANTGLEVDFAIGDHDGRKVLAIAWGEGSERQRFAIKTFRRVRTTGDIVLMVCPRCCSVAERLVIESGISCRRCSDSQPNGGVYFRRYREKHLAGRDKRLAELEACGYQSVTPPPKKKIPVDSTKILQSIAELDDDAQQRLREWIRTRTHKPCRKSLTVEVQWMVYAVDSDTKWRDVRDWIAKHA